MAFGKATLICLLSLALIFTLAIAKRGLKRNRALINLVKRIQRLQRRMCAGERRRGRKCTLKIVGAEAAKPKPTESAKKQSETDAYNRIISSCYPPVKKACLSIASHCYTSAMTKRSAPSRTRDSKDLFSRKPKWRVKFQATCKLCRRICWV